MEDQYLYLIGIAVILVILGVSIWRGRKEQEERLLRKIRKGWGNVPEREFSYDEFETINHYFKVKKAENDFVLDDITWNDLGMDDLFLLMNQTMSSVGEEYLYYLLRTPSTDQSILNERRRLIDFFGANQELREQVQKKLSKLGYTRYFSLTDYLENLSNLEAGSNISHYLGILLYVLSIVIYFLEPSIGIVAFVGSLIFNAITYFKEKAAVENYFVCISVITRLSAVSQEMQTLNIPEIKIYCEKLKQASDSMKSVASDARWIGSGGVKLSLNFAESLMEYVRMFTHIDLIKFNQVISKVKKEKEKIASMYECLGLLESMIAAASFKKMMPYTCQPQFTNKKQIQMDEIYHPMVENPVANSISETRPVLLTGSNASGKSTFLKTVALNAVLAQEFNFALAKKYQGNFYHIYSSMALKDNLLGNESYYMVEIKSLKRILDAAKTSDAAILCFVDEVLRGTNTVERIAASSKILECLAKAGVTCFAATHDIELTHLLEDYYANYHFREEIGEKDVIFNYHLYPGRATTRNAIRLLEKMGYDVNITKEADETAKHFLETGDWRLMS
ncbi:MAG: hypothetical protein ACI4C1_02780 [Lachnospiraceae bacterium]